MATGKGISASELDRELKTARLSCAYLVTGPEVNLVRTSIRLLKDKILGPDSTNQLSFYEFDSTECKFENIDSALRTVSFLNDRKLILVRAGDKISEDLSSLILDYIDRPIPETFLVLSAPKVDARTKLFTTFAKKGVVVECKPLVGDRLLSWINTEARALKKNIARDAAELLSEFSAGDLDQILNSLERLALYVGANNLISRNDVEEVVAEAHQKQIFAFTDAVADKNLQQALKRLSFVSEGGTPDVVVLAMIARHFRILSKAREVAGKMNDPATLAAYIGAHPFYAKNYVRQAMNFSASELKKVFGKLYRCDRDLKGGAKLPKSLVLEKLVVDILKTK